MSSCSFQNSCHFFQRHQKPTAGSKLTRQLYIRHCLEGASQECAIRRQFELSKTHPPRTLRPDGGRFIDASEIYLLGLVALAFALFAGLLTTYCTIR